MYTWTMSGKNTVSDIGEAILQPENLEMNDNENEHTGDVIFLADELDTTQSLIKFDMQSKNFCRSTCKLYFFFYCKDETKS